MRPSTLAVLVTAVGVVSGCVPSDPAPPALGLQRVDGDDLRIVVPLCPGEEVEAVSAESVEQETEARDVPFTMDGGRSYVVKGSDLQPDDDVISVRTDELTYSGNLDDGLPDQSTGQVMVDGERMQEAALTAEDCDE